MAAMLRNSYYHQEVTHQSYTGKGEIKQQATFIGFDFTNVWAIDPAINDSYPYLQKIHQQGQI